MSFSDRYESVQIGTDPSAPETTNRYDGVPTHSERVWGTSYLVGVCSGHRSKPVRGTDRYGGTKEVRDKRQHVTAGVRILDASTGLLGGFVEVRREPDRRFFETAPTPPVSGPVDWPWTSP